MNLKGYDLNRYVQNMTDLPLQHNAVRASVRGGVTPRNVDWRRPFGQVREVSSDSMEIERFRTLYDQVYDDLWRYCQRRSSSHEQAVDVLSETMLVMWERIDDVPAGDGARPWMFGVARNQLRKRNESASRSDRLVERLKLEFSVRRSSTDPAEEVNAYSVLETLGQLSDDDQELLRLQAWEGLSHKEIGQMFGATENAISIRIHRARQKFAALLSEGEE